MKLLMLSLSLMIWEQWLTLMGNYILKVQKQVLL